MCVIGTGIGLGGLPKRRPPGPKDMGKAGEWRPRDIANVFGFGSKITGNIPDLIKAIGALDDDVTKAKWTIRLRVGRKPVEPWQPPPAE